MPELAAGSLEASASAFASLSLKEPAANAYIALAGLHVQGRDPLRARWSVQEAWKLTDETDVPVRLQLTAIGAQATALMGEVSEALQGLDSIRSVTETYGQRAVMDWLSARVFCLTVGLDWQGALATARLLVDAASTGDPQTTDPEALYEASVLASLAGDHLLAEDWIGRAMAAWTGSLEAPHDLALRAYGRRGFIRARAGNAPDAAADFRQALEIAEQLREATAIVCQYDNLFSVAHAAGLDVKEAMGRWHDATDLRVSDVYWGDSGYRGLLSADAGRLYDARTNHLYSLHSKLAANSFNGVTHTLARLARLYQQANRPLDALRLFVMAGEDDGLEALTQALRDDCTHDQADAVTRILRASGATARERACVAKAAEGLADVLPEASVDVLCQQLLSYCQVDAIHAEPTQSALLALAALSLRMPDAVVDTVVPMAIAVLQTTDRALWATRRAAVQCLADIGDRIPSPQHGLVVDTLMAHLDDPAVGHEALSALVYLAPCMGGSLEQQVRDEVSTRALVRRQVLAAQRLVRDMSGTLPEQVADAIVCWYVQYMTKQEDMASSGNWEMGGGPTLSSLCVFRQFIGDSHRCVITERLLRLSTHADNLLAKREDAIAAIGRIADIIPDGMVCDVAKTLCRLASGLELGSRAQMIANTASDPFERYVMKCGTTEATRGMALISAAQVSERLTPRARHKVFRCILQYVGDPAADVRSCAAVAMTHMLAFLPQVDRRSAVSHLYALLYDNRPEVQQAAIFALHGFTNACTEHQTRLCWDRLAALCSASSVQVRRNALLALKRFAAVRTDQARADALVELAREMAGDVSHAVRSEAAIIAGPLPGDNSG